jgi:predicted PurR-regulated permease PerM
VTDSKETGVLPPAGEDATAPVVTFQMSKRSIWAIIGAVILALIGVIVFREARSLVSMIFISFFFSLALEPAVDHLHKKRGWKRGAAVGVIYLAGILGLGALILFLIPATVEVAQQIGSGLDAWLGDTSKWLNDTFGLDVSLSFGGGTAEDGAAAAGDWSSQAFGDVLGIATSGLGLLFNAATIAMFTFYFSADAPRFRHAVLSTMTAERQIKVGWTWDQAVEQTGGYFYSRFILMIINGFGFFFTMLVVGIPTLMAIPLAIFAGFVSEFIPAIGTYIGAAIPILVALVFQGTIAALGILAYALIYQQIENYWLSPKLSSKTMELNGALAFGSAIAGGAIAGPMGAFMALPIAALITAFISNYRTPHPVVYHSQYDESDPDSDDDTDSATADESSSAAKA